MKLRLTRTAARQLDQILTEIAQLHPPGARAVQRRIQDAMDLLLRHPQVGQATGRRNIRRIVITPYPYVFTYRLGDGEIVIRTLRHTARRPLV
ncbi:type II toxin-antitoxin system RelE/ParE family toxin [Methylobacterium organophilum]|uniref:type II toxin-antitoxin system RelE/ParE family toxin n=1 Tax=Methylobacterium organophilum TaxID=410 RepID=UPI001F140A1B|nr:type II toxin-antitoxin system RelE/ParE family toxin [Methylobacterium organophilum]UMY18019.1 type II toxin-antitoxin system RelE/ParE family toxin [Methylobacterium organophilum]